MTQRRRVHVELRDIERGHDWMALSKESTADSDRGCALLLAAFLDTHLEKMIRSVMIEDVGTVNMLFEYPGPLSSFTAKIRMAYCLRLLFPHEYRDLIRIAKIRNRFAHDLYGVYFDKDAQIDGLCRAMESRRLRGIDDSDISSRWVFWLNAYGIASDLDWRTMNERTERRVVAKPVINKKGKPIRKKRK